MEKDIDVAAIFCQSAESFPRLISMQTTPALLSRFLLAFDCIKRHRITIVSGGKSINHGCKYQVMLLDSLLIDIFSVRD